MSLRNETELANTRRKLARLEAHYQRLSVRKNGDETLRKATMASLERHINEFREEIARYEARRTAQQA